MDNVWRHIATAIEHLEEARRYIDDQTIRDGIEDFVLMVQANKDKIPDVDILECGCIADEFGCQGYHGT